MPHGSSAAGPSWSPYPARVLDRCLPSARRWRIIHPPFLALLLAAALLLGCSSETPDAASTASASSAISNNSTDGDAIGQPPSEPSAESSTASPAPADSLPEPLAPATGESDSVPAVPADPATPNGEGNPHGELQPVPIQAGVAELGPQNTKITFIGTHAGGEPNPRLGGFAAFSGKLGLEPETSRLASVSLDVETASVWTEIPRLTNHLASPDFFEVRQYPNATFVSTAVRPDPQNANSYMIEGELTLHGQTRPIRFPATVATSAAGVTLVSEFTLDRTEFGMIWGPDRVENEVAVTVVVGERTDPPGS